MRLALALGLCLVFVAVLALWCLTRPSAPPVAATAPAALPPTASPIQPGPRTEANDSKPSKDIEAETPLAQQEALEKAAEKKMIDAMTKAAAGKGHGKSDKVHMLGDNPLEEDQAAQEFMNLHKGNIAYNAPDKMKTGESAIITAAIGSDTVSLQNLKAGLPQGPNTTTASLPTLVTTKMKVTLTGPDFTITKLSSEEQVVVGDDPTTWKWSVKPKRSGSLTLHLAAIIEMKAGAKDYKTVDSAITVKVDPLDASEEFMKENWQYLLGSLGGLGAIAGWLKRKKKSENKQTVLLP